MREILFRGKWIDNGEWVYGNLNYGTIKIKSIKDSYYISDFDVNPWDKKFYPIIPETVGQYTGLTDKNGKKIFEGDILKICYESPLFDGYDTECIYYNGIVKYENALLVCEENSERGDALCALSSNEFEIIGNIYDNSDLLGGDKK